MENRTTQKSIPKCQIIWKMSRITNNNQQYQYHEQVAAQQQNVGYQSQSLHGSNAYVDVGGNAHAYHDASAASAGYASNGYHASNGAAQQKHYGYQ